MIPYSDYMSGKASHHDYFKQFVSPWVLSHVKNNIGEAKIKASADVHFNDISLEYWDALHPYIMYHCRPKVKDTGQGYSLSTSVCIAKAAAKIIKDGETC